MNLHTNLLGRDLMFKDPTNEHHLTRGTVVACWVSEQQPAHASLMVTLGLQDGRLVTVTSWECKHATPVAA